MRKSIIITILAVFAFVDPADAKSRTLSDFIGKVSSSLVRFDFSFTMTSPRSKAKMTGSGDVRVQDNAFVMNGNGLEVWCDGSTRWTVDRLAAEALVEKVEDSAESYSTNPALMITSVDSAFEETSFSSGSFQGKGVDVSVLSPLNKGRYSMDIAELKLYFQKGTTVLVGAEAKMNDGSVSEFTLKNFSFSDRLQTKESFRFDEKTLDDSYVVTDLR